MGQTLPFVSLEYETAVGGADPPQAHRLPAGWSVTSQACHVQRDRGCDAIRFGTWLLKLIGSLKAATLRKPFDRTAQRDEGPQSALNCCGGGVKALSCANPERASSKESLDLREDSRQGYFRCAGLELSLTWGKSTQQRDHLRCLESALSYGDILGAA